VHPGRCTCIVSICDLRCWSFTTRLECPCWSMVRNYALLPFFLLGVVFVQISQVSRFICLPVFQRHADITHIVHLASYQQIDDDGDGSGSGSLLGPPREVISTGPKAGLLESLLEHMHKHANETGGAAPPHFTYASSVSVYPRNSAAAAGAAGATAAPWTENSVLQPKQQQMHHPAVPSTWYGASRLLDERLVHAYHDMYPQLYSVGLRFSTVYGPAADPSTPIHLLAQRAVLLSATTNATTYAPPPPLPDDMHPEDERDYIYIDDAVDAILSVSILIVLCVWTMGISIKKS
jgi:dTDP-D-glucose 4,6-dehydratase